MSKVVCGVVLLACLFAPGAKAAETYPARPVKIISPFAAGGATDAVARLVAAGLSDELKQAFIVEDKPGAGGSLGTALVAKSKPDGYTLGVASLGTVVVSPLLMKLSYDPATELVPVINVALSPNVLLINDLLPVDSFPAFVAYAKANPGKIRFASSGVGATNHIFCETISAYAGIEMTHVPYKGSAPALVDLMGGQLEAMCDVSSALQYVREGKLKALAVGAPARLKGFPSVPTMAELGIGQANFSAWYGIVAPAGTPDSVVKMLNEKINGILRTDRARQALASIDAQPIGGSPADFAQTIRTNSADIGEVIRIRKIRVEQ
ncbi:hypothetical protein BOSP111201_26940 [Bordetella sputigena]|uniref:Bug family tripartite tricarboxylate transporter substrate binding protein n=1 Tax=Bordetella sputigena TaxID=1416810 RepID=UPI0039EEC864